MLMDDVERAGEILRNEAVPLVARFRALFMLRSVPTDESVQEISKAFAHASVLLKHELAYVLGQTANPSALDILVRVLEDGSENEIARHEAAEAIANFRNETHLPLLEKYSDPVVSMSIPVAETCQIGADLVRRGRADTETGTSPFGSLDPAPADSEDDLQRLEEAYLDEGLSLFRRYMALFKLRNIGTDEAVAVIGKGFGGKKRSALFEHKVAFVFGQMAMGSSLPYLKAVLEDQERHEIVRHECAEALGSVGGKEALEALVKHRGDGSAIVRESIDVALDIHSYKGGDEFEYAAA